MTGLRVVEINIFVQGVVFEPGEGNNKAPKQKEKPKEKEAQPVAAEPVEPEPPRVK